MRVRASAAVAQLRPPWALSLRLPVASDALIPLALVGGCAVMAALTWGTWGDLSRDTGYDLVAAAKTAHGQLPYVDYVYYYGPLGPFLLAGAYGLLGAGVGPAIALGIGLACAIVGLTYRLGRLLVSPAAGALAAALTMSAAFSADNNSYVLPHSLSAPLAIALSLAALGLVVAFDAQRAAGRRFPLVLAGAAAGLVALTRPEFELALVAALVAYLLLCRPVQSGRRRLLTDAALVALPAVAIPALVYGLVVTSIPASQLVGDNLFPVGPLHRAGAHLLTLSAPLTAGSFVTLAARLAAYAAAAGMLVALGRAIDRGGRRAQLAASVAVCAGVAFVALLAVRPEAVRHLLQTVYGWIPAGAALSALFVALRARRAGKRTSAQLAGALVVSVFLAVLAAKTYAAFYPHPNAGHPQMAAYAMPFAAVFLVWLHLRVLPGRSAGGRLLGTGWVALLAAAGVVLAVRDARTETVVVRGAHGSLAAPPSDGRAIQGAVDAIATRTSPGAPILLAPQLATLYVMTGRQEPLPQISLLPGALAGRAGERRAISRLHAVRLAITNRHPYSQYGYGAFGRSFDRDLGAWLHANFAHVATLRGAAAAGATPMVLDVWQRRRG